MRNTEVVEKFLRREKGRSLNMHSDGEKLYSYNTVMAQWVTTNDGIRYLWGNETKYSRTTSKQVSKLSRHFDKRLSGLDYGVQDLRPKKRERKERE